MASSNQAAGFLLPVSRRFCDPVPAPQQDTQVTKRHLLCCSHCLRASGPLPGGRFQGGAAPDPTPHAAPNTPCLVMSISTWRRQGAHGGVSETLMSWGHSRVGDRSLVPGRWGGVSLGGALSLSLG